MLDLDPIRERLAAATPDPWAPWLDLPLPRTIAVAARLMASVKVAFGPHMLCRAEGGEINVAPHPGCPDFFFGDLEGDPDHE